VSDISQTKTLDGRPATFLRFHGPNKYIVAIDGEARTIAGDEWRRLPSYPNAATHDAATDVRQT
jgi:hypothetical protein